MIVMATYILYHQNSYFFVAVCFQVQRRIFLVCLWDGRGLPFDSFPFSSPVWPNGTHKRGRWAVRRTSTCRSFQSRTSTARVFDEMRFSSILVPKSDQAFTKEPSYNFGYFNTGNCGIG